MKAKLKRCAALLLALVLVCGSVTFARADWVIPWPVEDPDLTQDAYGDCGAVADTVYWYLDVSEQTLYIYGNGAMADYDSSSNNPNERTYAPWSAWTNRDYESNIYTIVIREGVTHIGQEAFYSVEFADKVSIPASVTTIGIRAFISNNWLCDFELAEGNENFSVHDGLLYTKDGTELVQCPSGKTGTVEVPAGVKAIRESAFEMCWKVTGVTLPEGVTAIGPRAFTYCRALTEITVRDELETIGARAFEGCVVLNELALPASVTEIGENGFSGCRALRSVKLPGGLQEISSGLFENCKNLATVVIPASVTTLNGAFFGCDKLETLYYLGTEEQWSNVNYHPLSIPEGVTIRFAPNGLYSITVEQPENGTVRASHLYAAADETVSLHLSAVTPGYDLDHFVVDGADLIGETFTVTGDHTVTAKLTQRWVTDEGGSCGYGVFWAITPDDHTLHLYGNGAMDDYGSIGMRPYTFMQGRDVTNLDIGPGITHIGQCAFSSFGLKGEVFIPNTVETIGDWAFSGCADLEKITVEEGSANYVSVDGVLFNKDMTTLLAYPGSKPGITYQIPDTVTVLAGYAFSSNQNLRWLRIPDRVTDVGFSTFLDAVGLLGVVLPEGLTRIERYAFANCRSLAAIRIPNTVTFIGENAFQGCGLLYNILKEVDETIFGADSYTAEIPAVSARLTGGPVMARLEGGTVLAAAGETGTVELPDVLETIDARAFYGCSSLTAVEIPASVTTLGEAVFAGCTGLQAISLAVGSGDFAVEDGVLFNKDKTTLLQYPAGQAAANYTVPGTVTKLSAEAFAGSGKLVSLAIPVGVTEIGAAAFRECVSLQTVTIPEGIASLSDDAFADCESLRVIGLPASLTYVGERAFSRCWTLSEICYGGTEEQWDAMGGSHDEDNQRFWTARVNYQTGLETLPAAEGALAAVDTAEGKNTCVVYLDETGRALRQLYVDGQPVDGDTVTVAGAHTVAAQVIPLLRNVAHVTENGALTLTVAAPEGLAEGQLLLAAAYDGQGAMVEVAAVSLAEGRLTCTFRAADEGMLFRLYALDGAAFAPLGDGWQLVLQ